MKKFISLILLAAVLVSTVLLTSCDQEAIDKAYDESKKTVAELFAPFFKKFEGTEESSSSTDSSELENGETGDSETGDSETGDSETGDSETGDYEINDDADI